MNRTAVIGVRALSVALAWGLADMAVAAPVKVSLRGQIATVDDPAGVLDGSVIVGGMFTGTYSFDSTVVDTNADVTVGIYPQVAPNSVNVQMGSYTFESDTSNPDYLIAVVNRSTDNYQVLSRRNRPVSPSLLVEFISWQLDDPTETALADDSLPETPPVLSQWQSLVGFTVTGGAPSPSGPPGTIDPTRAFLIRGHVESVELDSGCTAVFDCLGNAGTVIFLQEGAPAPQGWIHLGRTFIPLARGTGRQRFLHLDVYRKN